MSANLTIVWYNKNNKAQVFPAHLFCLLGTTVTVLNGPVLAKDNDTGANAVVKYKLLGARMNIFTVDANTGKTVNHSARTIKYLYQKHRV